MRLRNIGLIICSILLFFVACKKSDVPDVKEFGRVSIDSISPAVAPVGSYITVFGNNFAYLEKDVKVQLNEVELEVVEATPTQLFLKIPVGTSTGLLKFWFNRKDPRNTNFNYSEQLSAEVTGPELKVDNNYIPVPVITALPSSARPGERITISGYNFTRPNDIEVYFGTDIGEIIHVADREITVKLPLSAQSGNVLLTVQQQSKTSLPRPFTINEPLLVSLYFTDYDRLFEGAIENGLFQTKVLFDAGGGTDGPRTIAVDHDRNRIYWFNEYTFQLMHGPLDGSAAGEVLYDNNANLEFISNMVLDGTNNILYMTSLNMNTGHSTILKADLKTPGSPFQTLYSFTNGEYLFRLTVNAAAGTLYWTEEIGSDIYMGDVDGTTAAKKIYSAAGNSISIAVDHNSNSLFVSDYFGTIKKGNLDGTASLSAIVQPGTGASRISHLVVAAGSLYWVDLESGTLYKSGHDGSDKESVFTHGDLQSVVDFVVEVE